MSKTSEARQNWIFTFGSGQLHEGYYVKIYGTFSEAREEMVSRHGTQWGFQYTEEEWDKFVKETQEHSMKLFGCPNMLPIEKELK